MTRPAVQCGAFLDPWPGSARSRRCSFRARWWVTAGGDPLPVCGTHARGWGYRWPLVTDDGRADRLAALGAIG